jgi:hypothetical protein
MLWALMSPDAFGLLVENCGWQPSGYAERLAVLLSRTFLTPGLTPGHREGSGGPATSH